MKGSGRRRRRDPHDSVDEAPPGSSAWLAAQELAQISASGTTIMIGGHDDFVDAVYLDDGADDPVSGTIVLGDELDSSGAFDAVAPPSRSMDPRVRARRIAVKRALGRKRLIWMGAIALVVLIVVAALAVFASSLFAVQQVDVTGDVYTDQQQLQTIIDEIVGQPILLVDTLAIEKQLELIPWVERAIVTTYFPHSVAIDLRERNAVHVGRDRMLQVANSEREWPVDSHDHVGSAALHAGCGFFHESSRAFLFRRRDAVFEVELDHVGAARVRLVDVLVDVHRHVHERAPDREIGVHEMSFIRA